MHDVPEFVAALQRDPESRERIPCPVCGSGDLAHLYEGVALRGNDLILDICLRCTHMFINPRPPMSAFKEFYQKDNYFELCANFFKVSLEEKLAQFDKQEFWDERATHGQRLYDKHLKGHLKEGDIAFDFGCGDGAWLLGLQQASGCEVDGEEISGIYAKVVEKRIGHPIFYGPVEEVADGIVAKYRGKVSVAIVSGSLQHMLDPMLCLRAARKILKDDGLLYVCNWSIFEHFMAQYGDAPRRLLGENLSWEHTHYFHETSFKYMLRAAGFEIVDFAMNSEVRAGHMEALVRKTDEVPELPTPGEVNKVIMRIHALEAATYAERLRRVGLDHKNAHLAAPFPRVKP